MISFLKALPIWAIPKGIFFAPINYDTGIPESLNNKKSIIEAFKLEDINKLKNNSIDKSYNYGKLIKFRQFY